MDKIIEIGKRAKEAASLLAGLSAAEKNQALEAMSQALLSGSDQIIAANKIDLETGKENQLSSALMDRLTLNEDRIADMAQGLSQLISVKDPIGESRESWISEDGLEIKKVQVPLGVIGIIYEARPNVTADAAGLCLKAGNAVILRGSRDAINSNMKIVEILQAALENTKAGKFSLQLLEDTSREMANKMMQLTQYIDVLIPRGGQGLINAVIDNAKIPVIQTGTGNCHAFVDQSADLEMALKIIENGKTQRPGVCNALETVLVHKEVAEKILPPMEELLQKHSVELRACSRAQEFLKGAKEASQEDFATEFLDMILAVKVVDSFDEAVAHINRFGSGHSEVIITSDYENSRRFHREVDAAAIYVNASTRFSDGGKFGFGAEIGISTQKLHARGPMGVQHLTSYKYQISGNGEIR